MQGFEGALEENILTLLCWDDKNAPIVSLRVDPELFSTRDTRKIAKLARDHLAKYGKAPGPHLPDLLEDDLKREASGKILRDTLVMMERLRGKLQSQFVMDELDGFIRLRQLAIKNDRVAELIMKGDAAGAEAEFFKLEQARLDKPGIWLHEPSQSLSFMDKQDIEFMSSGVDALDELGIMPGRGLMTLLMAPTGFGKSWWLVAVGKRALLHHKKVLHVTLEMPEGQVAQRYIQSLFAMTIGEQTDFVKGQWIERDRDGDFRRFVDPTRQEGYSPKEESLAFERIRPELRPLIAHRMRFLRRRAPLLIKKFPTGSLTVEQLYSFLQLLKSAQGFVPDVVLLDYPDLMKLDKRQVREDTSQTYIGLRGLADEEIGNFALCVVTQGNRQSAGKTRNRANFVAEDWSKIATSDIVLSGSQTESESEQGLARLFVDKARGAADKQTILLTQSLATGQFAFDSMRMTARAAEEVLAVSGDDDDRSGDDDRQVRKTRRAHKSRSD